VEKGYTSIEKLLFIVERFGANLLAGAGHGYLAWGLTERSIWLTSSKHAYFFGF
jgi:hypothetical protein